MDMRWAEFGINTATFVIAAVTFFWTWRANRRHVKVSLTCKPDRLEPLIMRVVNDGGQSVKLQNPSLELRWHGTLARGSLSTGTVAPGEIITSSFKFVEVISTLKSLDKTGDISIRAYITQVHADKTRIYRSKWLHLNVKKMEDERKQALEQSKGLLSKKIPPGLRPTRPTVIDLDLIE